MGFPEIGYIIRLILVFHFNIKKKNQAHKTNPDKEDKNDFWTGLIIFVLIVSVAFLFYFID